MKAHEEVREGRQDGAVSFRVRKIVVRMDGKLG